MLDARRGLGLGVRVHRSHHGPLPEHWRKEIVPAQPPQTICHIEGPRRLRAPSVVSTAIG
jgi:hypothetical protein